MKKNPDGTYIADPQFPAEIYPVRIMRTCSNGHEWGCVSKAPDEERVKTDKFLWWLVRNCPLCKRQDDNNVYADIK